MSTENVIRDYAWGLDLSQTLQGAGWVGGLLAVDDQSDAYYATYDGNGNVSELVDSSVTVDGHYTYDPYGKRISTAGANELDHPFRFSTMYLDDETSLYYYGLRHYSPGLGRWTKRDPIGDPGFVLGVRGTTESLRRGRIPTELPYSFVSNNPLSRIGHLGLEDVVSEEKKKRAKGKSNSYKCPIPKGSRTLCKICVIGRAHLISGVCTTCQRSCTQWCATYYTESVISGGTLPSGWLELCVLDCQMRTVVCIASGCKLKFNP